VPEQPHHCSAQPLTLLGRHVGRPTARAPYPGRYSARGERDGGGRGIAYRPR
jgi:hypothetical protein